MFEQLLMQAAEASFAASATDLLIAVTGLIAAIGAILIGLSGFMKAGKAKNFALQAGQVAQVANQKAVESKDRIQTGLDAIYQLAPAEQKKVLDETMPKLDQLKKEVEVGTAQVDRINSILPDFNANKLSIPREDFETKPSTFAVKRRTTTTK